MKTVVGVAVLSLVTSVQVHAKGIYGDDNRVQVSEATPFQQQFAKRAASMISENDMTRDPSRPGLVQFSQRSLKSWLDEQMTESSAPKLKTLFSPKVLQAAQAGVTFCESERFVNEPNPSMCSGFLIAPDLLVTAGHCAQMPTFCSEYSWVFDFQVDPDTNKAGVDVKEENIYKCKRVVSSSLSMALGLDYAVVQLDRRVSDREPLEIRNDELIAADAPIFVIGSPSGLPLKVAGGANVRKNAHPFYFSANLDTYAGNSGSGVFNAVTGVIEGILVRGDEDFVPNKDKQCIESNRCTNEGCRGEDVTRITAIPEVGLQRVLNRAAQSGDLATVQKILKLNLWVDFYTKDGQTALMKAASTAKEAILKALLEKGAEVNLQDAAGNTALHHLAKILSPKTATALTVLTSSKANLELRNDAAETPLLMAARHLNLAGVKMLIAAGAEKNALDSNGESALFAFARKGDQKAMKELIALGVDAAIKNKDGALASEIGASKVALK